MTVDSLNAAYEVALQKRMKACAAELDGAFSPPPSLRTLLADQRPTPRPFGRISLRVGLSIGAGILAIALVLGLPILGGYQNSGPLSSVTPSALVTPSDSPAAPPPPVVASPSLSPAASATLAAPSPSPSPSIAREAGSLT
jgi:cell division septation protein DedD